MKAAILILATLFSTTSLANSYCESRDTTRAIFQCYDAIAPSEMEKMKGFYEKIRNHPATTQEALQLLEFDHQNWAGLLDASCRDSRCGYTALVNRNNALASRLNALGPVQAGNSEPENCVDSWISAFREEMGEDAMIVGEQLDEWKGWCSEGKQP